MIPRAWDVITSHFVINQCIMIQITSSLISRAGETAFFVEAATFPKCDIVLPTGLPTFPTFPTKRH